MDQNSHQYPSSDIAPHSSQRSYKYSPYNSDHTNFSYAVFKYMNDILMEEDIDGQSCMLQDCLALQATEKSFYDVLGEKYPPSPNGICSCSIDSTNNCTASNPAEFHGSALSRLSREGPLDDQVVAGAGRKHHHSDGNCLEEGRSNKYSAPLLEESEQSDLFDEAMTPKGGNYDFVDCPLCERAGTVHQCDEKIKRCKDRTTRQANKLELVDLWSLLTKCAQAVASYDQSRANMQLKQIRQHSSPFGDGTQRLAHYFANSLEARLAGICTPSYSPAYINSTSVADILKALLVYVSASPFRKASNVLTNQTIGKVAEKATRLHIIDFGISYGFQWPCFIKRESYRPGGPPKLRITGIELPQSGFRPAERVEETGRRLKKVCEGCNVPFEFNAIAQKWETIKLEDLRIDRDEMTVVTCMYRLNDLPGDTIVLNSPRDAVLNLIRRINPDLFVHGVTNGTYNSPFFITRFREALLHFSGMFDMFEATVPSEDQGRVIFERELLGRQVMSVVACEGLEITDVPETYKQWQARTMRAGFRQLPLDQKLLERVRKLVKTDYHKDFVFDENGKMMLQGWKGKVMFALSFWKPVQE